MRALSAVLVVPLVVLAACNGPDARPDAALDSSGSIDAGADAPDVEPTDAGWVYWDGGTTLPPVRWTLPACESAHGTLHRTDTDNPANVELLVVAASAGRAAIAWAGPSSRWGEIRDGEYAPLPDGPAGYAPLASALYVAPDRLLAVDAVPPPGGGVFQIVAADGELTSALPIVHDRIDAARPRNDWGLFRAPAGPWLVVASLSVDGETERATLLPLSDSFEPIGDPIALSEMPLFDHDRLVVVEDTDRYLAIRTFECNTCVPQYDIEIVPFDADTVGAARTLGRLRGLNEHSIQHMTAARDGEVAVIVWRSPPQHPPSYTAVVEVDMGTGATVAGPYVVGVAHGPEQLTSSPGGGVDLVRQPKAEGWSYDELLNTDNPLEVYVGVERPLSLEGHTPLRLGAGAYGWNVRTARDGDRLLVVWEEQGPATERDERGGRRMVQGLYWAILEGCPPTL